MTLTDILTGLAKHNADAALIFSTEASEIAGGYHVTEVKAAQLTSIDCGGRLSHWTEASVQLLDGRFGSHMKVGKFQGILAQSLSVVEALRTAPVHVEFAPGNQGLRRYEIASVESDAASVTVRLREGRAQCKPAAGHGVAPVPDTKRRSETRCCGEPGGPAAPTQARLSPSP